MLMLTFYATCLFFIFVVLGLIARFHGFSVWKLIKYLKEELFIVLGTSSSEAALPRMMVKLENLGAKKSVVGLVIPTGYSFNLDGTSIYLTLAAVFIAQATNTPLDLTHQLTLLAVLAADLQRRCGRYRQRLYRAGRNAARPSDMFRSQALRLFSASTASCPKRARSPISSATVWPQWWSPSGPMNWTLSKCVAVSTRKPTWRQAHPK